MFKSRIGTINLHVHVHVDRPHSPGCICTVDDIAVTYCSPFTTIVHFYTTTMWNVTIRVHKSGGHWKWTSMGNWWSTWVLWMFNLLNTLKSFVKFWGKFLHFCTGIIARSKTERLKLDIASSKRTRSGNLETATIKLFNNNIFIRTRSTLTSWQHLQQFTYFIFLLYKPYQTRAFHGH